MRDRQTIVSHQARGCRNTKKEICIDDRKSLMMYARTINKMQNKESMGYGINLEPP